MREGETQPSNFILCFRPYDHTIDLHACARKDRNSPKFMLTRQEEDYSDDDAAELAVAVRTINDTPSTVSAYGATFLRTQRIDLPETSIADSMRDDVSRALEELLKHAVNKDLVPMHAAMTQKNGLAVDVVCRPGDFTFYGDDIKPFPNTQLLSQTGRRHHRMIFSPRLQPDRARGPDWIKAQWKFLGTQHYATWHVTDCSTKMKLTVRLAVEKGDPLKPLDIAQGDRLSPKKKAAIARVQNATTQYEVLNLDADSDPTTITDQLVKDAFHRAILAVLYPGEQRSNYFPSPTGDVLNTAVTPRPSPSCPSQKIALPRPQNCRRSSTSRRTNKSFYARPLYG
eukprot:GEMP01048100.1.p1 GENE.GEMP01048100.1~~GEMP01048100.1.p1  ORF type:complete len:341 (+),score=89.27 GEMP01048100.1:339-1361(+)